MTFAEIIAAMKQYENSEEYKKFVDSLFTPERVKAFLDTEAGQKAMQPYIDKQSAKGLETWKTNNLQALIDAEIKTRFPEADPKDTELAKVKAQLEAMQKESARKELLIKAQAVATEKKLPVSLVSYFIGDDEKTTKANLETLEKVFTEALSASVEDRLKQGHIPNGDKNEQMDGVTAAFMARNPGVKLN